MVRSPNKWDSNPLRLKSVNGIDSLVIQDIRPRRQEMYVASKNTLGVEMSAISVRRDKAAQHCPRRAGNKLGF